MLCDDHVTPTFEFAVSGQSWTAGSDLDEGDCREIPTRGRRGGGGGKKEERRSRGYHNEVEEQYRNRLNEQFESLLNALLEDIRRGSGGNNGGYSYKGLDSPGHKVGRAEVLDMARRHIKLLEQECAILRGERDELRNNAQTSR